jgi:hypothetical protein|tara:strand:+ start:2626 stop:2796 length:171 start_codon:yes stop_codon:yes gene_type:complete
MKKNKIDLASLKMWAKHSYPKFAEALKKYNAITKNGKYNADIIWHQDSSIEIKLTK